MTPFACERAVAPNQAPFIWTLLAFEAIVGTLVVTGGRGTRYVLVAIMAFHVVLLSFGWFFWALSLPMLAALGLLLRADVAAEAGSHTVAQPTHRGRVPAPH